MTLNTSIKMKTKFYTFIAILFTLLVCQHIGLTQCINLRIIGDDNNTVCFGSDISIIVDFVPDDCVENADFLEYAWSVDGAPDQPSLQVNNIQSSALYSVTITDPSNMDALIGVPSIEVTVTGPISVDLQVLTSPLCEGENVDLGATVMGNSGTPTYNWSNNVVGTNNMATEIIPDVGPETYSVTVTDAQGCTASDSETDTINPEPSISLTGQTSYCVGDDIVLTANSPGSSCRWFLPIGMQDSCTLLVPNANLNDTGIYTIEVTSTAGCIATQDAQIDVGQLIVQLNPTPAIPPGGVCINADPIALNPMPGGGTFTVDGVPNSDAIVGNSFFPNQVAPGTHEIEYTVTLGDSTGSTSITIIVNALPDVTFEPNPLPTLCLGAAPINLFDFVTPSGGQFFSGNDSISEGFFDPGDFGVGIHSLEYRVMDNNNCTGSAFSSITISAGPTVNTDPNINICMGTETQLNATAQGGSGNYTYQWSPAEYLTNAGIRTPRVLASLPTGMYTFSVTVTDQNKTCTGVGQQMVTVHPQPVASIAMDPPAICEGDAAKLTASFTGGFGSPSYSWNGNPGNDSLNTGPVFVNSSYAVEISFSTPGCGPARDTLRIFPQDTPEPVINATSSVICINQQSVFFSENRRVGSRFDWELDTEGLDIINFEEDGPVLWIHWGDNSGVENATIAVTEYFEGNNDCKSIASFEVSFTTGTAPDPAEIFLSPINNILIYNDSNVDCYQWGYMEDSLVPAEGETYQSYVTAEGYDEDKIYYCQVWDGDCDTPGCSTTVIYRSDEGGEVLPPEEEEQKFILYPNPNLGVFSVEANKLLVNTEYDIHVVNALGQLVKQQSAVTVEDELNANITLNNGASGVYYLILYLYGERKQVKPFVVQPKF